MIEYIENTNMQYIDTGVTPTKEYEPYKIPVYRCRMYNGEELIHDYQPCKNAEGVEGMYDIVTNEFMNKDNFAKMWLEHLSRSDTITWRIEGYNNG